MEKKDIPHGARVRMLSPDELPPPPLSSTEQFNQALEWLHFSRGSAQTLADYLHEAESIDLKDTALAVESVAAMIREGAERISRAHSLLRWEFAEQAGLTP